MRIAVLDTGIDHTHPYITEKWGRRAQPSKRYRDFLDDSMAAGELGIEPWTEARVEEIGRQLQRRQGDTPQDETGHETHAAGIIMRLCPEADLFVGRVLAENVTNKKQATRPPARRLALVSLR